MIRFIGINLSKYKKIQYALIKIYGIGIRRATEILNTLKISLELRLMELSKNLIIQIRHYIETNYLVENLLKRKISLHITRLKEIQCFRGKRHLLQLPVRGQRTRTNARTKKGKKKTVKGKN
uniref:Ribosomal protein S13 n=1 Tax=Pteridomonas sp. YPF1301 TaxID=2766739 RepID=A0A7G1MNE4_9STRA|nr:ribosomal protein S13 [Pteridomonas sp. YPF1301]